MTDEAPPMTPDEVRAARQQLGMTLAELADVMGLTGPYAPDVVRSWEKGRRNITGPAAMLLRFLLKYGPLDGDKAQKKPAGH